MRSLHHRSGLKLILGAVSALAFLAAGVRARADVDYSGGNGKTPDTAVIISGAGNGYELLHAEEYWIKDHYDHVSIRGRAEEPYRGATYDIVVFSSNARRPQNIFFQVRGPGQD
jgi:hypothetical protein